MQQIKLRSSDGEIFSTDIQIANCSGTLKTMIEVCRVDGSDAVVPLPNVHSTTLQNVLIWATYHKDDLQPTDEISSWDADFLKSNEETLLPLVLAADYLDIKGLLNLTTKAVADMIKDKSPEEIRQTFNISHDSAASEEKEIQTIKFRSSDGEVFNVGMQIAKCFSAIESRLELCLIDEEGNFIVPLPNTHSSIFRKVLVWAEYHKDDPQTTVYDESKEKRTDDISSWDAYFLNVDKGTLFELVKAAYYLNITGLLNMIRKTLTNSVKCKISEEICTNSNIKKVSTAMDEEQIMQKIKLLSADGDIFNTDMDIAKRFGTVKTMLNSDSISEAGGAVVPLPTVHSTILRKVLIWAKYHKNVSQPIVYDGYIPLWYVNFLKVDEETRFQLLCAAKDLDIEGLSELIDLIALYEIKDELP